MMNFLMGLWVLLNSTWMGGAQFDGHKTWVFAVSSRVYKYDKTLNMEMPDRRDEVLMKTLQKRGVPIQQIVFLKDQKTAHDNVVGQLKALLAKTQPGDTLIFYFQGHGNRDVEEEKSQYRFVVYDSNPETDENYFEMDELFDAIKANFRGSRLILTADCCYSGGLVALARRDAWKLPTACLASVNAHNQSTGEWTFTDGLIRGFGGDGRADLNHDGLITIEELGRYLESEMAFMERQKAVFTTVNGFESSFAVARASKLDPAIGMHVVVEGEDGPYLGEVVETDKQGRYRVTYAEYEGDDWLEKEELRPYQPSAPMAAGTVVKAYSENQEEWFKARVARSYQQLHLVHFDNQSSNNDEWVSPEHIKPWKKQKSSARNP